MADALLKHHLRLQLSGAGQGDALRLQGEGRLHPLQPGEIALGIAQAPPFGCPLQGPVRYQLDHIRLLSGVMLLSPDGEYRRPAHWHASMARRSSSSISSL